MWQLLIPVISNVVDKVIPDSKARDEAKLEMFRMAQSGELKEMEAALSIAQGQIEVNKEEAKHDNFRGGWRPACGWTCVAGLFYQFLAAPLLPWFAQLVGYQVPPLPPIDNETLMVLLTGMLGLGGMRSFEKVRGKA